MKRIILFILTVLFTCCNTQKHIETNRVESTKNEVAIDETTNKNTIKVITITEYREKKDSVTGEYPVKSVTNITETNNDKIKSKTTSATEQDIEEEHKEDKKTEQKFTSYLIAFGLGALTVIILYLIVRLVIWYIKRKI